MNAFDLDDDLAPLGQGEPREESAPAQATSVVAEALRRMTAVAEPEEEEDSGLLPPQPRSFLQLGLSRAFLTDLTLKIIHYGGTPTVAQLSRRMGIPQTLVQQIISLLTADKLVEPMSQADLYSGTYRYRLSSRGSEQVREALERSRYAGPVPVPAEKYAEVIRRQLNRRHLPARGRIKESLSGVVLAEEVADSVARALFSGRTALFYGPSGNGKTSIFQGFAEHIDGIAAIPYSIYAHGQVVRVFDPTIHTVVSEDGDEGSAKDDRFDRRWVIVRRPVIMVGPEMAIETLDLAYDPLSRFYQAPPHIKAQGGVLIVDDLGRQKIDAPAVLSRLLIPLERGWDTLTLETGEKVIVPFNVQLLFGTNLPVHTLADESMLRRIPYKVEVANPSPQAFTEILHRLIDQWRIQVTEGALPLVTQRLYSHPQLEPRAAHAGELLRIIAESAQFDGQQPILDEASFERALTMYVMERGKLGAV